MKYQGEELYRVYICHDPGMTLTYLKVAYAFEWGKVGNCNLIAENLLEMSKWTEYKYVCKKNIIKILNIFLSKTAWPINAKLNMEDP